MGRITGLSDIGHGKLIAIASISGIMCIFADCNQWSVFSMWDKDSVLQRLRESLGGVEIRALAREVPCSLLLPCLAEEDIRVARNAAWVLTHKSPTEIRTLPQDGLIDLSLTTPDRSLRRLTLCLVERQGIAAEEVRTDFLDFCLLHMRLPQEPPGVQALCMKLAHSMCSPYPDLVREFQETLSIMQPELYKPGVRHLINKMKKER